MNVVVCKFRNIERVLLIAETPADMAQVTLLVRAYGWELDPSGQGAYIPYIFTSTVSEFNQRAVATAIRETHASWRTPMRVKVNRH
jgi:hypothetical protein